MYLHKQTRHVMNDPDRVWFTSDTHFGHRRIIELCKRPWYDVTDMDEALIDRWNSRVGVNDTVFHLGDFAFLKEHEAVHVLARLHGRKRWIVGNHDRYLLNSKAVMAHFDFVADYTEINIKQLNRHAVLCHFPFGSWHRMHHGAWNLHGHSHGNYPAKGKQLDVGVDVHDWFPINAAQIAEYMDKREFMWADQHGRPRENDDATGTQETTG